MKVLKIQRKNLLNMKMVVSYLNFVFFVLVKVESNYRILNFVFDFIKNTKWHFGYTDSIASKVYGYANSLSCKLCLIDKYWIIKYFDDPNLLNKKSELINKCRHQNKIFLMNIKR